MNSLIKELVSVVSTTIPAYDGKAPKGAEFPFAVITVNTPFMRGERNDFSVFIDVWDNNTDNAPINEIAMALKVALEGHTHVSDTEAFFIGRVGIGTIPDPDETIRRRRLTVTVRSYFIRD